MSTVAVVTLKLVWSSAHRLCSQLTNRMTSAAAARPRPMFGLYTVTAKSSEFHPSTGLTRLSRPRLGVGNPSEGVRPRIHAIAQKDLANGVASAAASAQSPLLCPLAMRLACCA